MDKNWGKPSMDWVERSISNTERRCQSGSTVPQHTTRKDRVDTREKEASESCSSYTAVNADQLLFLLEPWHGNQRTSLKDYFQISLPLMKANRVLIICFSNNKEPPPFYLFYVPAEVKKEDKGNQLFLLLPNWLCKCFQDDIGERRTILWPLLKNTL